MAWYDTGTVTVTNGSTTVTGSSTAFLTAKVQIGEAFYGPDDNLYEIAAIVSETQLTLADNYLGSTQSGQAYKIIPTQSLVADLAEDVTTLISDFADVRDIVGEGKFQDGSVSAPAITFNTDQDNGLYRIGSNNWALAGGGLKQIELTATEVDLNYAGSTKLTTKVDGVDVTGVLTVSSDVSIADKIIHTGDTNTAIRFPAADTVTIETGGTERARVDSSGNLLVGTTTLGVATVNGEGFNVYSSGQTHISQDSNVGLLINRKTNDGTLVDFKKDGATVGSIGTGSSLLTIGTGTGRLIFDNALIAPCSSGTGGSSNGVIDLGSSARAFKDLYLSGGVYLGGTGAANLLDDYEQGTFDVTLTPATSGTITLNIYADRLSYAKIGNLVHVQGNLRIDSVSSPVGTTVSLNLPFTNPSAVEYLERIFSSVLFYDDSTTTTSIIFFTAVDGASSSVNIAIDASTLATGDQFRFNFSYRTSF